MKMRLMCRSGGKDAALQDGGRVEDYNANCLPENPPSSSSQEQPGQHVLCHLCVWRHLLAKVPHHSPTRLIIRRPGVQLVIFGVDLSLFATFGLLCNSLGQDVFYWANFDFSNYGDQ